MRQLKRKGSKMPQWLKTYAKIEILIGAILIGNNAVNVLASAVATSAALAFLVIVGWFLLPYS